MSDQTEREAELIAERDRAREECGYEKTMRKALHNELGMWILLRREERDRAEAAEARVRELEGAAQQLRDAHQGEVEKVTRVEALRDRWRVSSAAFIAGDASDELDAALRGES